MKARLSPAAVETIRAVLASSGRGSRDAVVGRLSAAFGVSASTIYRAANVGGARRGRAATRPEYREWARVAVRLAHEAPQPIPLDLAIEEGIERGVLPREAAGMPLSTARAVMRELGLTLRTRRHQRLRAEWPMQAVQMDASTSEHLIAERPRGDDWILRFHRRPWSAGGYKNKPLRDHRMRVLVYAVWDMCTGLVLARYGIERGESALGALEFLCWAFGASKDPRLVMCGVPDDLWVDQGPAAKSAPARDLMERLGVRLVLGPPYQKTRMGGVERSHRTRWARFERPLFLRGRDEILLSEINARLVEFTVRENGLRRSRTPIGARTPSRAEAWAALVRRRPTPLRALPANPIETLAREMRAKIDGGGCIRWDGVEYEAGGGWHDRWVIARRAMDGSGDLVIEDVATGALETARRTRPRPYGEIRAAAKTPLDRLLEEPAPGAATGAGPYAPARTEGLIPFPIGTAPAAPLENPLDPDRLRGAEEAWRVFTSIWPHQLSAENRAMLGERFEGAGFRRSAVVEIAASLHTLRQRRA